MKHLLPFLALLLAFSCASPSSVEQFRRGSGPYSFSVDMTDTTAVYDLDLYTRIDGRNIPPMLELSVQWTSPSDSVYHETVFLPLSPEVYVHYRADMSPWEPGVWKLDISASSARSVPGLRGLGLVVKKRGAYTSESSLRDPSHKWAPPSYAAEGGHRFGGICPPLSLA